MSNPISIARFHEEVVKFYEHSPRIPYSREGGANYTAVDCRGVVLGAVRNAGYRDFRFAGTNDFMNTCCKWQGTPEEAKRLGYWNPGLILFNLDESTGKTTHMGVLTEKRATLYPDIEKRAAGDIINSSASKDGMILSDSETSGGWWNWCALAKDNVINYSAWFDGVIDDKYEAAEDTGAQVETETTPTAATATKTTPGPGQAMVVTNDRKGLNLREGPDTKAEGIKLMPDDTIVDILRMQTGADGRAWARVRWTISKSLWHEGWCCADYLIFGGED